MSFANKVVIITGASSGIGAATAISFAKEGANVVIVGRKEQKLQKLWIILHVAVDLAQYGVRVNTISPGPVKTDILSNASIETPTPENKVEGISTPLGRISESEEIADLILFVASDKAKAITGSDYVTDNGSMLMSINEIAKVMQ
ncbi:unnamed protein product [Euphydryas editha]|uniref:Uncharacterized protein n=1 Tax=Euphydryas editha TaxID=104508 RepID=A0AAU9U5G7_EUPED|nr:unnamed protein product [Euphydryas editha]